MLHLVVLASRRQVCGIRTLVTSVLSAAVLWPGAPAPVAAQSMLPSATDNVRVTGPAREVPAPGPAAQGAPTIATPTTATPPTATQTSATQTSAAPGPSGTPLASPAAAAASTAAPGSARVIAVLLPLDSPVFGRAAAHVRNGITAAWSQSPAKGRIDLRFITIGDQPNDVITSYNVALAANAQAIVGPLIRDQVTAERVSAFFAHYEPGEVRRWELPGISAINILIDSVLGGTGGTSTLRYDPQGKSYAAMLLTLPVVVPAAWDREGLLAAEAVS